LELITEILPGLLIDHFDVVFHHQVGIVLTKKMELEIFLDEKNELPKKYNPIEYESRGFLPPSRVQDFPIRGKAVYLLIRRRRWRHKITKKEVSNNYSFIAEGSRLTHELSDFLKGTGRDSRRYDK